MNIYEPWKIPLIPVGSKVYTLWLFKSLLWKPWPIEIDYLWLFPERRNGDFPFCKPLNSHKSPFPTTFRRLLPMVTNGDLPIIFQSKPTYYCGSNNITNHSQNHHKFYMGGINMYKPSTMKWFMALFLPTDGNKPKRLAQGDAIFGCWAAPDTSTAGSGRLWKSPNDMEHHGG